MSQQDNNNTMNNSQSSYSSSSGVSTWTCDSEFELSYTWPPLSLSPNSFMKKKFESSVWAVPTGFTSISPVDTEASNSSNNSEFGSPPLFGSDAFFLNLINNVDTEFNKRMTKNTRRPSPNPCVECRNGIVPCSDCLFKPKKEKSPVDVKQHKPKQHQHSPVHKPKQHQCSPVHAQSPQYQCSPVHAQSQQHQCSPVHAQAQQHQRSPVHRAQQHQRSPVHHASPRQLSPQQYSPPQYSPPQYSPPQYSPPQYSPPQFSPPRQYSPPQHSPRQYSPPQHSPRQLSPQHPSPHQVSPQQMSPQLYMPPREQSIRPMCMEIPPPFMVHDCAAGVSMPLFCELHREAQRYYCQTCSRPFCAECGLRVHMGHVTIHLMEAMERAGQQASQVMHEAQLSMATYKEDLESLQLTAELLQQKSRDAVNDVMQTIRKVVRALETREKELIEVIDKSRQEKYVVLKNRDDELRYCMGRLTRASDRLQDAMESATLASNPFDLLVTKDMASAEVFQSRYARVEMPPLEENWISFNGNENAAVAIISTMGEVATSSPGPIGDRRTVRSRANDIPSPQVMDPFSYTYYRGGSPAMAAASVNFPLAPVPRGRAISGYGLPVTVHKGLISQQVPRLPISQLGNGGDLHDNLCRPWGVTCDRDGNIIVADRSNNRIQIFRMDGSLVRRFGTHGTGPAQFDRPAGVAVDARKRIVVADKDNHRVQVLTMEGHFLLWFGEKGNKYGQFNYPWDVAVNAECQIVVSDTRNHRIQLFSPEGIFLRKFGFDSSTMWKSFDSPRGVAFNPEGNVAVTDFNNHRVVIVDADFMNFRILNIDLGHNNRQLQRPQGLIVDDEGNIIVADSRNHRVLIFDSTGTLKGQVGTADRGPEQMDRPSGVALTPDGRILVVDFGNNRVLMI